jgi:hypothetical protein
MLRYPPYDPAHQDRGTSGLPDRRARDLGAGGLDPGKQARDDAFWAEIDDTWARRLDEPDADPAEIAAEREKARTMRAEAQAREDARRGRLLGPEGSAAQRAARSLVPEDPYGGHRPVWLLRFGVVCMDCDWKVTNLTWFYGSPGAAGADHRALHLDPPARGLCQWEPMPAWFYYPWPPSHWPRDLQGRGWPPPADRGWRTRDDWLDVCRDCFDGLTRDEEQYQAPRRGS